MREDNLKNLLKRVSKKAHTPIPNSVMFEITERCNLRCKFCYLGKQRNTESDMPIGKVFNIINQLQQAGCIEVVLLGGEPLIRKDFAQIYKYIKKKGLLITIFTNATLITPKIADLFKEYPPHHLRMSIYAGSSEGYDRIAGSSDAFKKIKKAVILLKRRGINFTFRSLITNINFDEFEKMKEFCRRIRGKILDKDNYNIQYQ